MRKVKHKLGQVYWRLVKKKEDSAYKIKKWIESLLIWLKGFQRVKYDLQRADIIIVCAHPDDETIFFSSVLKQKKPFVICASHLGNLIRREEFKSALVEYGVKGVMLNLPDVKGGQFIWKLYLPIKLKILRTKFPNVRTVYTHAGIGESGHPHHFCVNRAVKKAFSDCTIYHTAELFEPKSEGLLNAEDLATKKAVIENIYSSQIKMLQRWCSWYDNFLRYEVFYEEK